VEGKMTSEAQTERPVILIYDDEEGSALGIRDQLTTVDGLDLRLLQDAKVQVELLERRRRSARTGNDHDEERSSFDEADVLIVDYDLTASGDQQGGPAETGERVAYLARCYSKCGTIVALNQYSVTATFDLSLIGHISSYADINLSGDQIGNPALWGRSREGFASWSWPDLTVAPTLQRNREALLADRTGDSALAVLGLDEPNISNTLTRNQLAWLSPDATPDKARVEDVVRYGRIGFRPSDEPWDEEGIERVAAARLAKWLERLVLPGQNVLVDAPHLVSRFPSLAAGEDLNETTRLGPHAPTGLIDDRLSDHRLSQNVWLSRPAWLWPTLSEDTSIDEVRDPFRAVGASKFFTEDSSMFRDQHWCRAFAADVEPFSRRFVTRAPRGDEINQSPYSGPYGLGRVQYQPQLRFAL
jgi:hypothetical protein